MGEVVDRQPEGVFDEIIHRLFERAQRQLGGTGRRDIGERPQGLNARAWKIVHHAVGQDVERIGHAAVPETEHARRCGADMAVFGVEQGLQQRRFHLTGRFVHPQRFEARFISGLPAGPSRQVGLNVREAAFDEDAFGLFAIVGVGRKQLVEQHRVARLDEVGFGEERTPLRRDPPDASVDVIAARVAEIHFAVLDDRIRPVRDVERPIGTELHIDGPEGLW